MVAENNLYKYSGALEKLNFKKEIEKNGSRSVELFFSFDIVNLVLCNDVYFEIDSLFVRFVNILHFTAVLTWSTAGF